MPDRAAAAPEPLPAPRRMPRAVREFLRTEAAAGAVVVVAVVVALAWANSPWRAGYRSLWETELALSLGRLSLAEDLRHWVNDALMAVFFFVVGLEIKRELVAGELRSWRVAALPAVAAVGGMAVPAALYAAVNLGEEGARGWGIPMATDIALAVGVVGLLGRRLPSSLRLFLLSLAIVDDIGAVLVIAIFYSGGIRWTALAGAAGLLLAMGALHRARLFWWPAYAALAVSVWLCVYASGVHATMAGVALGLLAPARPQAPSQVAERWALDLAEDPAPSEVSDAVRRGGPTTSITERLEHALHPFAGFVVVPLFALANAGVELDATALKAEGAGAVVAGTALGLVVGKLVGVSGFAWLAVRLGLGSLPPGVRWAQMVGVGAVAGIGFTVSLFIAGLAFEAPALAAAAKLGILGASAAAAIMGGGLLWATGRGEGSLDFLSAQNDP